MWYIANEVSGYIAIQFPIDQYSLITGSSSNHDYIVQVVHTQLQIEFIHKLLLKAIKDSH